MEFAAELQKNREAVLEKWFEAIVRTYPQQTSQFLARQKDRFSNPVGYAIERSIGPVYDQVAAAMDTDALLEALDGIIRIRSVQEFKPSEAVSFVFQLKSIIREVLGERTGELEQSGGLAELDHRIDRVAVLAFDKYMECRQKLFEIRTREIRGQADKLLERYTSRPCTSPTRENAPMTSCDLGPEKGGCGR
ncbi:MAG: RsbRD N-terminal domain-containing protein [Candidatus Latescibacterota bacterium]|jgi:hypothetical protein